MADYLVSQLTSIGTTITESDTLIINDSSSSQTKSILYRDLRDNIANYVLDDINIGDDFLIFTNGTRYNDNIKLYFGDSNDVEIYYSPSSNYQVWNSASADGIIFQDDGVSKSVLQDDGSYRPAITSTGTIGISSHYWNNGYFTNFNVNSTLSVRGKIDLADNDYLTFGTSSDIEFFCDGSDMYTDLNAGIGNWYIRDGSTIRFTFDDNGDFTATGDINSNSDIRLKENITPLENSLEKVKQLRGVEYDRKDINCHQIGVIAQEVEKIYPEFVSEGEGGIKRVSYGQMVSVLIEAIKDLSKEVDTLKSIINN